MEFRSEVITSHWQCISYLLFKEPSFMFFLLTTLSATRGPDFCKLRQEVYHRIFSSCSQCYHSKTETPSLQLSLAWLCVGRSIDQSNCYGVGVFFIVILHL